MADSEELNSSDRSEPSGGKAISILPETSRYIHSNIFDRLQTEPHDLVGLVAYGLYQRRKREWIDSFEIAEKRSPTEDEVKAYCFTFNDSVLNDLRRQATNLIFRVSEEFANERLPEMQQEAFNARTTSELVKLNTAIKHISGYRHHIVGHVIGFFVLVLLVWLALFVLHHEPVVSQFFSENHSASVIGATR